MPGYGCRVECGQRACLHSSLMEKTFASSASNHFSIRRSCQCQGKGRSTCCAYVSTSFRQMRIQSYLAHKVNDPRPGSRKSHASQSRAVFYSEPMKKSYLQKNASKIVPVYEQDELCTCVASASILACAKWLLSTEGRTQSQMDVVTIDVCQGSRCRTLKKVGEVIGHPFPF